MVAGRRPGGGQPSSWRRSRSTSAGRRARRESAQSAAVDLHGRGPESQRLLLALEPARLVAFGHPDVPASLVASAGRVVSGDTGVAHLASATGTPSVVLFGPIPRSE